MQQPMSILTSSATEEWFTPPYYIGLIKAVLGKIDLDPASDPLPQQWIQAGTYWTKKEDGLSRDWFGNVFLNPPFGKEAGRSTASVWTRKIISEFQSGNFKEGIMLIHSTHGYSWYENLWTSYTVCCAKERIKFIRQNGSVGGQAKRGQTFVLFNRKYETLEKFKTIFEEVGRVIPPASKTEIFTRYGYDEVDRINDLAAGEMPWPKKAS